MTQRLAWFRALFVGSLVLAASPGWADVFPARPIRLVVGFAPGAQTDSTARLVAQQLGELLGQTMVVENRAGAGGTIGAEAAARSTADGYTLLLGGPGNLTLGPAINGRLRYDTLRDFVAIGRVARISLVLAVNSKVPATSVSELLNLARTRPGQLTYASAGRTSVMNLAVESLKIAAGVEVVEVPYKGSAPAVTDVVAGRVDFIFADFAVLEPHARSGALRLLATSGAQRMRAAPDLPTVAEGGVAGYELETWNGIVAPSGTPPEVVAKLRQALRQALGTPGVVQGLERMGFETIDEPPEAFTAILQTESERFGRLAKQVGLTGEP